MTLAGEQTQSIMFHVRNVGVMDRFNMITRSENLKATVSPYVLLTTNETRRLVVDIHAPSMGHPTLDNVYILASSSLLHEVPYTLIHITVQITVSAASSPSPSKAVVIATAIGLAVATVIVVGVVVCCIHLRRKSRMASHNVEKQELRSNQKDLTHSNAIYFKPGTEDAYP